MSIVLLRLDDRLIHGQVVSGWVKALYATSISVIDGDVAGDAFQQSLMRMAVPEGIDVYVVSAENSAGLLKGLAESAERAIVLFSQVEDLCKVHSATGLFVDSINIGGVRFRQGREKLTDSLFLSPEETRMLLELEEAGVEVEVRPTPFDKSLGFPALVKQSSQIGAKTEEDV